MYLNLLTPPYFGLKYQENPIRSNCADALTSGVKSLRVLQSLLTLPSDVQTSLGLENPGSTRMTSQEGRRLFISDDSADEQYLLGFIIVV